MLTSRIRVQSTWRQFSKERQINQQGKIHRGSHETRFAMRHGFESRGGGALDIFRVRGRAIGKGIYFPDIGIKNGINFHNFVQGTVPVFKIFR